MYQVLTKTLNSLVSKINISYWYEQFSDFSICSSSKRFLKWETFLLIFKLCVYQPFAVTTKYISCPEGPEKFIGKDFIWHLWLFDALPENKNCFCQLPFCNRTFLSRKAKFTCSPFLFGQDLIRKCIHGRSIGKVEESNCSWRAFA